MEIAAISENINALTASLDDDSKIYDQSVVTKANILFTITNSVLPSPPQLLTDGEELGTTVSISEFLESVIKHTPKENEDLERLLGPAKAKNCETIPQILERILQIKRTKEILYQMVNTAFFEDATMIDHLRMSITTGDSMTPSPFLKIFIGLMSATDCTANSKSTPPTSRTR